MLKKNKNLFSIHHRTCFLQVFCLSIIWAGEQFYVKLLAIVMLAVFILVDLFQIYSNSGETFEQFLYIWPEY